MQDGIIKGTGNSRFLKSVPDFLSQYPTYESFVAALAAGTLPVDFNGINETGWQQLGTALNKGNLLSDETAKLTIQPKAEVVEATNANVRKVVFGAGKLVAIAASGVSYSIDGRSWTNGTLPAGNQYNLLDIIYANDLFVMVGGSPSGIGFVYSRDGATWVAASTPSVSGYCREVTYGAGKFVTIVDGTSKALYSDDGIAWKAASLPYSGPWYSIAFGNGKFIASCSGEQYRDFAYSSNGIDWTRGTSPFSDVPSMHFVKDHFVAANNVEYGISRDGVVWDKYPSIAKKRFVEMIDLNQTTYALLGSTPAIVYSHDLVHWWSVLIPSANAPVAACVYNDGIFLGYVGGLGTISGFFRPGADAEATSVPETPDKMYEYLLQQISELRTVVNILSK